MNIKVATVDDRSALLALMRESFARVPHHHAPWNKVEAAITILLNDPQAGEAILMLQDGKLIGYLIICRGFSLDYGGYFTWLEETYIRETGQAPFQEKRYIP